MSEIDAARFKGRTEEQKETELDKKEETKILAQRGENQIEL